MRNKYINLSFVGLAGIVLSVFFNNCGKGTSLDSANGASGAINTDLFNAADACTEKEIDVFDRGYHQFLKNTCYNCHVSGPGIGTFAHPDVKMAYDGFNMHGYEKISQYAVSNHQPGTTGTQNTEIINSLRLQWQTYQTDKQACTGGTATTSSPTADKTVFTPNFETSTKAIPALTSTQKTVKVAGADVQVTEYSRNVITWDLSKELTAIGAKAAPALDGAKISITVTGFITASKSTAYLFTMPTLQVGSKSIHLVGLNFRLNGFPIPYATTFKKLDKSVYQNTTALLAPGSLVSVGPLGTGDTLALQIGDLETIALAAPPSPPAVEFNLAALNIEKTQLGTANAITIQVNVIGDNPDPILVPVAFAAASAYAAGEVPAVNVMDTTTGMKRFDWNYKLDPTTTPSLSIYPNQKTATFKIIFSDDLRHDVDKVLRLQIGTPFGATIGSKNIMRITLPNYNPVYTGTAPTFAQLMGPKGVLGANCVKCHNSVQKQGGYDMTDYQDMVARGILVPGDLNPEHHKMYRRMNADSPNLLGLQSMPLDGFLPKEVTNLVNDWITAGAKNN